MSAIREAIQRQIRALLGPNLKENINRLIVRTPTGALPEVQRGPVLGSTGQSSPSIDVDPEPPEELLLRGLYGQPTPNPNQDKGALWFESGGTWTAFKPTDWDDQTPYPPGVRVGNVGYENADTMHAVSWHWYPVGGPPGNAVKYVPFPADFKAWISSEQGGDPGGDLSRDVLHAGRRLYRLPDYYACIGACIADNWLFMVGLNLAGVGGSWIYSGYDVDLTVTCSASTTTQLFVADNPLASPDTVFLPDTMIRVDGLEGEVLATSGPLPPNNCYEIELKAALGGIPAPGAAIEIVRSQGAFTGATKVFAIETSVDVDDELQVAPDATLYDIETIDETEWIQQFIGHPQGRNMVGMQYGLHSSGFFHERNISRLAFDTGTTPPTSTHTVEEKFIPLNDTWNVDVVSTGPDDSGCVFTQGPDLQEVNTRTGECINCEGGPVYECYDVEYVGDQFFQYKFTQTSSVTRKVRTSDGSSSRVIAIDYNPDGTEALATLEITYDSTIDIEVENSYRDGRTSAGSLLITLLDCNPPIARFTEQGFITVTDEKKSTFSASKKLSTTFSVDLAINGVNKVQLGSFSENFTWVQTDPTRTGRETDITYIEPDNDEFGVAIGQLFDCRTDPDWTCETAFQMFCLYPRGKNVLGPSDSEGTLTQINCLHNADYVYDSWPAEDASYDLRRLATPLKYFDIRSGIYVTEGREGVIDEIYELPASQEFNFQMYPYTVDVSDFNPPAPIADFTSYEQNTAAWGLNFTPEAGISEPLPTSWVQMKDIQPKSTQQGNPITWKPMTSFMRTADSESKEQGCATRDTRSLVNVFIELPTAGAETLQAVELRNPTDDPLALVNISGADRITGIGMV